jgi:serine phosphatase RsbU (regulator of sigma subunit)
MKLLGLAFSLLMALTTFSQKGTVELTDGNLGQSFTKEVLVLEDSEGEYSLEEVLEMPDDRFFSPKNEIANLDFTASTFWLRFSIKNNSSSAHFILETARPITNEVEFYQMRGSNIENHYRSGDAYQSDEKVIPHRKNLFPIVMYPSQKKDYLVRLKSDGEVVTLPLRISDRLSFFEKDAKSQFAYGFYYGLMCLVVIIYFFFFVLLKDRAFFFYITYVAAQALLQFSLDGYTFIHLFPSGGYLANHFVIFIAGTTMFVLLLYVSNFLHLKERNPLISRVFKICQGLIVLTVVLSLIPGLTYEIAYPVINYVSLVSTILSVIAIYRLKYKGFQVDSFFAIAFTVLIAGAVVFIFGNFNIIGNAEIAQAALKISSALEVAILSISMSNKYRALQRDKEEAQAVAMKSLEEQNELVAGMNVKLEAQVKERTAEINHQKEELAEINNEIVASLQYAKRIQEAILPQNEEVKKLMPESLIFYRPKDVVSGDFYFVEKTTTVTGLELILFAAVDCTGHGVPGAFMSIVGSNYLNQAISEPTVNTPAEALNFLNVGVNHSLRQDVNTTATTVRDGMDIALCGYDKASRKIYFAGAKNPIYIIRKSENVADLGFHFEGQKDPVKDEKQPVYLQEIKGDSHPIGAYIGDKLKPFTDHTIQLREGDMVYVFSDGYADQFGGPNGKKYKYKTFKHFLLKISQFPVEEQKQLLIEDYDQWKGGFEQIDDVLVMGVRVV